MASERRREPCLTGAGGLREIRRQGRSRGSKLAPGIQGNSILRRLFAGITIVEPQVAVLNEGVGKPAFRIFLSDHRTRAMGKKKKA